MPQYNDIFLRPIEASGRGIDACSTYIKAECTETQGFIKENRLLLRRGVSLIDSRHHFILWTLIFAAFKRIEVQVPLCRILICSNSGAAAEGACAAGAAHRVAADHHKPRASWNRVTMPPHRAPGHALPKPVQRLARLHRSLPPAFRSALLYK